VHTPGVAGLSAADWPELHRSPQLTGYAANGTVSASNAGTLGVRWAVDLYSAAADSPVVAYDSSRGRTLAYIGADDGNFFAVDTATRAIAWVVRLDGPVVASPLVSGGAVWVGAGPTIYKLNASTGAIECSQATAAGIYSSPVAATPPLGVAAVYFATLKPNGKVLAVSAADCAMRWTFANYALSAVTWDPLSYAVDARGTPLLLFGSSDPDDAAYAVNASTGALVWRFHTSGTGDLDVGSGITVSLPGANGFADGIAYVPGKNGLVYALDLTTGAERWQVSLGSYGGQPNESLSTPALDGTDLVVGEGVGVTDFNAVTGALRWRYQTPTFSQIVPPGPAEVISSPAISGPPGQQVVAFGDLAGAFRALALANGKPLYQYQTASWISGSPAVTSGNILVGSSDGFLYDFSASKGNKVPATAITAPASGSVVANPAGNLTVSGTASGSSGVSAVVVAVRQGGRHGTWWDAATSSWSATPVTELAVLTSPGTTSTSWNMAFAVPPSGNAYWIDAYAVSAQGPSTVPAATDEFFVSPAGGSTGAALSLSHGFAAPGGTVTAQGTGFAPNETVTISVLGTAVAQATALANGSLPATQLTLPGTAGFGATSLVATGTASGRAAAASLYVTGSWPQLGGGPGRTGVEAHDFVFQDTLDPGQNILLYPAWRFAAGTAPTPPAVADQLVYVGDHTGTLHALRATDGTQKWSWRTPTAAAITGSPAVDAAAGLAFAAAANGGLYAIFTSGPRVGTLAWSASVGSGDIQSPAFDGKTVYAASTSGTVVARSEATGAWVWSATTSAGAAAAPALDPTGRILVVPTSSGMTALSASTGALLWSFPVAGPASPVLANGVIYVGSSNHDVYAVSETTGHQIWSFRTGGAIQDSGVLSTSTGGSTLFIGSADGKLYALNAATGAKRFAYALGASARGLAIAGDTVLATTSTGLVEGVRDSGGSLVWSYAAGSSALSPPAVANGTFYAAGLQGTLWAFTPYGAPPQ
jgi:outer membrane protein assembly factor BamB